MNYLILSEHLKLELTGESFLCPTLEAKRQSYIAWIVSELNDCEI